MSDCPPLICPPPRISKACDGCRTRKLRCLPSNAAGVCKRCLDLKFICQYTTKNNETMKVNGRRKQQPAASKVNNGSNHPDDEDALDNLFSSKPQPKVASFGMIQHLHRQIFDKILPSSPFWSSGTTPQSEPASVTETYSPEDKISSTPQPSSRLNIEDISRYLRQFQERQTYFPFISLPDGITTQVMMKRRPFLLLGILAAMSSNDSRVNRRLDAKFRRVLAEKTIESDERSLDLLQGLLVYVAWYPLHFNPASLQVFKILKIATDMAVDLKLDRHTDVVLVVDPVGYDSSLNYLSNMEHDKPDNVLARKLAYIGCYYFSAAMTMSFGRPNNLPFTPYTQFCVDGIATTDIERRAQELVKLQRLAEEAADFSDLKTQLNAASTSSKISSLLSRLQTLKQDYSNSTSSHTLKIHSIPLPLPRFAANEIPQIAQSPESITHLTNCLTSTLQLLNDISSLPSPTLQGFTTVEWNRVVESVIILSRLCFPIPLVPEWDDVRAREKISFSKVLRGLETKMREVSLSFSASSENGRQNQNPTTFLLFCSVLEVVRQKYEERAAEYEHQRELANILNSSHPYALDLEMESGNKAQTSQCPVMNGSLAGTQYWEAMESINAILPPVTGNRGGGIGNFGPEEQIGNELFDTGVLDDWYLWGVKMPDWHEGVDMGVGDDYPI